MKVTGHKTRLDASLPQESPPYATLLGLPPELIHPIVRRLDLADILSVRLTCRVLADVGLDHILHAVVAFYKRSRFERLGEIAAHPMAKNVRSFYFQADRYEQPPMSYKDWNMQREFGKLIGKPETTLPKLAIYFQDRVKKKTLRAYNRAWDKLERLKNPHFSAEQLRQAYREYKAAVLDQSDIAWSKMDISSLTRFFEACHKLEKVTLALDEGVEDTTDYMLVAFGETMLRPEGDASDLERGVHQFWSVMQALYDSGRTLKHFTATGISHRLLIPTWNDMPTDTVMSHVMGGLRELRIEFICQDFSVDTANLVAQEMVEYHSKGLLAQWLSTNQSLRVLKLSNLVPDPETGSPPLERSLGTIMWPKLRELSLQEFSTTESYLLDVLLRHAKSLRRLSLSYLRLRDGTWESVFRRLGGKLEKLKKVKIRGTMLDPEAEYYFRYSLGGAERIDPRKDNVENYLLHGGQMPDLHDFDSLGIEDGKLVIHVPGYKQPGRTDDEDAGYTTDGSAISYSSDYLDERM